MALRSGQRAMAKAVESIMTRLETAADSVRTEARKSQSTGNKNSRAGQDRIMLALEQLQAGLARQSGAVESLAADV